MPWPILSRTGFSVMVYHLALLALVSATACGGLAVEVGTAETTESSSTTCTLTENTTVSGIVTSGCDLLDRDASGCEAERAAAGLSGVWLNFSCRVSLSVVMVDGVEYVKAEADGQPDYKSAYFETTDPCYEASSAVSANPNLIEAQDYEMLFPLNPDTSSQAMSLGAVGLSINGVPIFDNEAGPGDDIYEEVETFDLCQAHPTNSGQYHYHSEPFAISYDDANFIGVMRDGYSVYGRQDVDGTYPTLDTAGGHTAVTEDSPDVAVYHYHVNEQTSDTDGTAGTTAWFITTGTYAGTPGSCSNCQ